MAGVFIKKTELKSAYDEACTWTDDWQKPFNEYERLAGNKISKAISKHMPKVNDGSLAASLLETPMQVLPVMQSGKFKPTIKKTAWLGEIANIIWKNIIVPNANTQASFFDKEQIALYRALRYGAQPRYNFFVSSENYTGSDWSLPYIKNLKLEPGKLSVDDCDYLFLDVFFTKLQLEKIVDSVGKEKDSTWDVGNLKTLISLAKNEKEYEDLNAEEKERCTKSSGVKATICFNRGQGAPFYMFSKYLDDGKLLREWKNPDPTGDLPITMQYCYETLENPYGMGRVALAGPTQNVLDFFTQAHVLATQLGLEPPIKIQGATVDTNMNSIVFAARAKWLLGQAQVDVVNPNTSVYSQFPENYGLYKSQLQNLQGRTDASVSATSGNPEFSKTPAGIKFQQDRTNAQDNYLRNKADTAAAKMATKMMNVHLAQMEGADVLAIAKDEKERLEKAGYFDDKPETDIPSISEIKIKYAELKTTFKFEFDPRPEADIEEKNRAIELLDIVTSNPNVIPALQQSGYRLDLGELIKKIVGNSGMDDWEKLLIKINTPEMGGMGQEADPMENDSDKIKLIMEEYNTDENSARLMIRASQRGYSEEQILEFLQREKEGSLNV